jgi:hypothetical protein
MFALVAAGDSCPPESEVLEYTMSGTLCATGQENVSATGPHRRSGCVSV